MKNNLFRRRPHAARGSDVNLLFSARYNHRSFPSFYSSMARPNELACADDLACAYCLYLFLGETKNAR